MMKLRKEDFEKRKFYKVKKANKSFLCALCKAPRQISVSNKLTALNYAQIALISTICCWALYPIMREKVVFTVFIIWPFFEMVKRLMYRKQVPCPYCGFDATWYRRDVKVARKKVAEFWEENPLHPHNPKNTGDDALEDVARHIQ